MLVGSCGRGDVRRHLVASPYVWLTFTTLIPLTLAKCGLKMDSFTIGRVRLGSVVPITCTISNSARQTFPVFFNSSTFKTVFTHSGSKECIDRKIHCEANWALQVQPSSATVTLKAHLLDLKCIDQGGYTCGASNEAEKDCALNETRQLVIPECETISASITAANPPNIQVIPLGVKEINMTCTGTVKDPPSWQIGWFASSGGKSKELVTGIQTWTRNKTDKFVSMISVPLGRFRNDPKLFLACRIIKGAEVHQDDIQYELEVVKKCTLKASNATILGGGIGGLGYFYCEFTASCPDDEVLLFVTSTTGLHFNFSTEGRKSDQKPGSLATVKSVRDSASLLRIRVFVTITALQCSDEGMYLCDARYNLSRKTSPIAENKEMRVTGCEIDVKITSITPANLTKITHDVTSINLTCMVKVPALTADEVIIWFAISGGETNELLFDHLSKQLDKNSHTLFVSSVKVTVEQFRGNPDVMFVCGFPRSRPTHNVSTIKFPIEQVPVQTCDLFVDLENVTSLAGASTEFNCTWNNTRVDREWTWKLITSDGETVQKNQIDARITVSSGPEDRPTGVITFHYKQVKPSDDGTMVFVAQCWEDGSAEARSVASFTVQDCPLNLTTDTIELEVNADRPLKAIFRWSNDCLHRRWVWQIYSSLSGVKSSSPEINSTITGKPVKVTDTKLATGTIVITLPYVYTQCQDTLKLTCILTYDPSFEGENSTDSHVVFRIRGASPAKPKIGRSMPPRSLLMAGVKENTYLYIECLLNLGTDPKYFAEWKIFFPNNTEYNGVSDAKFRQTNVSGDGRCGRHVESVLYLNMTLKYQSVRLACCTGHPTTPQMSCSKGSAPCCASTNIIYIFYPVTHGRVSLKIDPPVPQLMDNATLTCCADGYPPASIIWLSNNKHRFLNPVDNANKACNSIRINSLTASDTGQYRCVAKNSLWGTMYSKHMIFRMTIFPEVCAEAAPNESEISDQILAAKDASKGGNSVYSILGAVAAIVSGLAAMAVLCFRKRPREISGE